MLLVLSVWLTLFALLVGWGLLLIWTLRRFGSITGALTTMQTMWLGYAGLLLFLLLCHFALPIGGLVLALSCLAALAGYALERRIVLRRLRGHARHPRACVVSAIAVLVAALAVAYAACDVTMWHDTGLYHQQVVKWNTAYPVVPGLANLHSRFGFNNSSLLFASLVEVFSHGIAMHAANGFLLAALFAQFLTEILGVASTPRRRLRQTFCLFALPFFLMKLWTIEVASLSTDLALSILCTVIVLELLSLPRGRSTHRLLPLALIVALGAAAFTTKFGGLVPFGIACAIALASSWRGTRRSRLALFALPAAIVVAWIVHGVIVSGWIAFPVFGRLPLSWSVPWRVGREEVRVVEAWSRMWGKPYKEVFGHGFWFWFVPWFENFRQRPELILFISSSFLLIWRCASGPTTSAARLAAEWIAIATCVLGIAQWFVKTPDLRYGAFWFWLLFATLNATLMANAMRDPVRRTTIVVMSLAMTTWCGGFAVRLGIVPDLWSVPDPVPAATDEKQAGPGTIIRVPKDSQHQCWDAELPCSLSADTQTLRDPDSLGAGFLPGPEPR